MSQENVRLFHRALDAFNRRDLEAFLELVHDDVRARPRMAAVEGPFQGHEGVRRWWKSADDSFTDVRTEVFEVRDLGDVTLARIRNRGRGAAGGTPVERHAWHVAEWRDGKVAWWAAFLTEADALEAARRS
jgi:ketosteroid isomerase-like protein